MNLIRAILRERQLWRDHKRDRWRWWFGERKNPLRSKTFSLGDKTYPYFVRPYNHTWRNERAIEIAVVSEFLKNEKPGEILEVGNVLSHYLDIDHVVVDRYEKCIFRPVINQDIMDYCPPRRFSAIASISTIEHVGWDDTPRDPEKVIRAFDKLASLLTPTGKALVTIPVGHNLFLDDCLRKSALNYAKIQCMKKISKANEWVETDLQDALKYQYGRPFKNANALLFIHLGA